VIESQVKDDKIFTNDITILMDFIGKLMQ